jgi:hypothetical protein
LSGGELQRFAIGIIRYARHAAHSRFNFRFVSCPRSPPPPPLSPPCSVQKADVYMFDEPSSYLDVKQRLKARSYATRSRYISAGSSTHSPSAASFARCWTPATSSLSWSTTCPLSTTSLISFVSCTECLERKFPPHALRVIQQCTLCRLGQRKYHGVRFH